jgi:hypothetical protein
MTNSSLIMDDLHLMLINLPQRGSCADEKGREVTAKYKNILHVFDGLFSLALTPSGLVTEEHIAKLQRFVAEGMKLWREMELSTEAPKPHAIEDHLIDQIIRFNGIGDLGEDFVEQSHQDGIKDDKRTRTIKDRATEAKIHCRGEHKRKLPAVQRKIEEVSMASKRTKRVIVNNIEAIVPVSRADEKKQIINHEKANVRLAALATTTSSDGVYIKTGRQRNIDDHKFQSPHATQIIKRIRMHLATRLIQKMRFALATKIIKTIRIHQAKVKLAKLKNASILFQ